MIQPVLVTLGFRARGSILLGPFLLSALLFGAGCPDKDKAKPPPQAGMAGLEGKAAPEAAPQAAAGKAEATVTTRREGEGTVLVATALAPAPANTEPKEAEKLATETARVLAQRELLNALQERGGKKLGGAEIPDLLKKMEVAEVKKVPGKGVRVVLQVAVEDTKKADERPGAQRR